MANFKSIVKIGGGLVTAIVGSIVALKGVSASKEWPCGDIEASEDSEFREMAAIPPLVEDSEEEEEPETEE